MKLKQINMKNLLYGKICRKNILIKTSHNKCLKKNKNKSKLSFVKLSISNLFKYFNTGVDMC